MDWVTLIWSMNVGICLTLAGVHLLAWTRYRRLWANLASALFSVSVAAVALFELALMHVETTGAFEQIIRWAQVPVFSLVLSFVVFIPLYLRAGRMWLFGTIIVIRLVLLVANFTGEGGVIFSEITSLTHVSLLGEQVSVPHGIPSDWQWLARMTDLLILWFVIDASVSAVRHGHRRRGIMVGTALPVSIIAAAVLSITLTRGAQDGPANVSLGFMILMVVMGYELGVDMVRAHRLASALKQNQDRMAMAAKAAGLGLWEWKARQGAVWLSDEVRALYGIDPAEPADPNWFYRTVHSEDRNRIRDEIEEALKEAGEFRIQHRIERANGLRWISTWGRMDADSEGNPYRVRGVSMDVTDAKEVESKLHFLRSELTHVTRVASLGQITTSLAHELSQPLTAILSNAEAGRRLLAQGNGNPGVLQEILDDIVADNVRASEILCQIRSLIRKEEIVHRPVEMAGIVRQVVRAVHNDAALRGVTVRSELQEDPMSVMGDRVQFQQVLMNLLLNAFDAVSESSRGEREVVISTIVEEGMVRVSVKDSGKGLDPEDLEGVFQPFHTTKPEGLGVGLSISRSIVEDHGGRIWCENNPAGGATFHFALPLADPSMVAEGRAGQSEDVEELNGC